MKGDMDMDGVLATVCDALAFIVALALLLLVLTS